MSTYSIGTPPTDATKLSNIQSVFNLLPDNTSKLIQPKDLRDSIFTVWENIGFKPTNTLGGSEYIGIDSDLLKEKILIGKKKIGGQFIMNNDLLGTDVDVFFYNTKTEPQDNYHTTVAFLAGTGSNTRFGSNIFAPYVKSTVVNNGQFGQTIDFEIQNPTFYTDGSGTESGGNIILRSQSGNIVLNGAIWPDFRENNKGSEYENYVLKYKWVSNKAYAVWEPAVTFSTADSLFSTGNVTITGNPVTINGFPIELTSPIPTPVNVGGVPAGTTFSNTPVVEVLRRMLYPYIQPTINLSFLYNLIEIGDVVTSGLQRLNWTITKNSTYSISSFTINGQYTGTLPNPNTIGNGSTNGSVTPQFNSNLLSTGTSQSQTIQYSCQVSDGASTVSTTSSFKMVLPWYFGSSTFSFTQSNINTILGTNSNPPQGFLSRLIAEPATSANSQFNKNINFTTSGFPLNQAYLYFGYPNSYPDIIQILDSNGYDVTTSWQKYEITGIQRLDRWVGKTFKFYIFKGSSNVPILTTTGVAPSYTSQFQFRFQ